MLRKILIIDERNTTEKTLHTELSTYFDITCSKNKKETQLQLSLNYKLFSSIVLCTDKINESIDETLIKIETNPIRAIIPVIIVDANTPVPADDAENTETTSADTEFHYMKLGASDYLLMSTSSSIIAKHIGNLINLCERTSLYKNFRKQNAATARMSAIMGNIQSGITAVAVGKRPYELLFSNDKFYEIIGCDKDKYAHIASTEFGCICPQDKDRILKKVKNMQLDTELTLEYQIVQFSGTRIWVRHHLSMFTMSDLDGIVRLGIMDDITAEKAVEEEANLARERIRRSELLDDSSSAVCVCEAKTYRLLYINKMCEQMFGKTMEGSEDQYCYTFLHNRTQPCTHCRIEYATNQAFTKYEYTDSICGRHYKTNAKFIDWAGIRAYVEFTTDETDSINQRLQLQANRRAIETASQNLGIAFWRYDLDTQIAEWNDSSSIQHKGLPEVLYNTFDSIIHQSFIHPNDIEQFTGMYKRLEEGAETSESTVRFINKTNGSYNYYHTVYTRLHDPYYKTRQAIGFSENVDLQMNIQAQYRKERQLRSQLLTNALIYYELDLTNRYVIEYQTKLTDIHTMESGKTITSEMRQEILDKVYEADKDNVRYHLFSNVLDNPNLQNSATSELSYRRYFPDGTLHWVKTSIIIMNQPNTLRKTAFVYLHDIDKEETDRLALSSIIDNYVKTLAIVDIKTGVTRFISTPIDSEDEITGQTFPLQKYFEKPSNEKCIEADIPKCKKFFTLKNLSQQLSKASIAEITYTTEDSQGCKKQQNSIAYYLDDLHAKIVIVKRSISEK